MSAVAARVAVGNHTAASLGLSTPRSRKTLVGHLRTNSNKRCSLSLVSHAQVRRVVVTGVSDKRQYGSSFGSSILTARSKRFDGRTSIKTCSASSSTTAEAPQEEQKNLNETLFLGVLFALWYLFNIWFNIYNKQVLKATATPFLSTAAQFGVGVAFAAIMWGSKIHKFPQITKSQVIGILPLAIVHTLGNLLTNVSLGKVAVSFTHTIKAMEPFFSVALSSIFLGSPVTAPVILSLIPIVGGVALASFSEASFNWAGFGAAMGSNLTFQSRNVLSKKLMTGDTKKGLDNINLFCIITVWSFILMLPIAFAVEGMKLAPSTLAAQGLDPQAVLTKLLLAGLFFHSYQQVSFMILERVSPVTHSVGNCVKRVIVIVASVIFFQNPVSPLNAVGTAMALSGVFLYSQVKRMQSAKPASAKV